MTERSTEKMNQVIGEERRDTDFLTEYMSEKLIDKTLIERYGTSLKMSMGKEYQSYLKDKYEKLKKEFVQIDKNGDDKIQFEELLSFFNSYKTKTGVELTDEYMENLYDFMDQNKDDAISV